MFAPNPRPVPSTGGPSSTALPAVAWTTGEGTVAVRADLVDAVERAAEALVAAGHRVEALTPPGLDRAHPTFSALRATDDYGDLAELAHGREGELSTRIRDLLDGSAGAG